MKNLGEYIVYLFKRIIHFFTVNHNSHLHYANLVHIRTKCPIRGEFVNRTHAGIENNEKVMIIEWNGAIKYFSSKSWAEQGKKILMYQPLTKLEVSKE